MGIASSADGALLRVVQLREELDRVAGALVPPHAVFRPLSLPIPKLQPAELGFDRCVTYLYVLYYEAGGVTIPYLLGLWDAFTLDPARHVREHHHCVSRLRASLQHNLDLSSSTDRATRQFCEQWLRERCGTPIPTSDDQWASCRDALLAEAASYLETMRDCVRAVERDEGRDGMVERWLFRISRYHAPEEFDVVISEATHDVGRPHLDVGRFRKRFYDQWMSSLSNLTTDYDFPSEARRLVEHALMFDASAGMPITGTDIINELGIAPGPAVGTALKQARQLYDAEPTDRRALLNRLRVELSRGDVSPPTGRDLPE